MTGGKSGSTTYAFEGLSAFRSNGCIVGVVVDGVDGVCKLQYFSQLEMAGGPTILVVVAVTATFSKELSLGEDR